MGSDFCFSYVILKHTEEETQRRIIEMIDKFEILELNDNPKNKVINSLKENKSENLKQFCGLWEEVNGDFENDYPVFEGKVITEKLAREKMKEIVNEFFGCLSLRDVGNIRFKGYEIYLSGGMSWGDSPTDSYNTMNKFNLLPTSILSAGEIE